MIRSNGDTFEINKVLTIIVTIITIISLSYGFGITMAQKSTYKDLKNHEERLATVEKKCQNTSERLARIETKLDMILDRVK